jgi:malonyl-CoA/methylmalonyl-CoA synthetase
LRPWTEHLPAAPGRGRGLGSHAEGPQSVAGTLLEVWLARWAEEPAAPLWMEDDPDRTRPRPGGWWTAARFEEATRSAAGGFAGAGLEPGARVLWSAASSVAALVAHVGALRAGLVVVPVSPASTARELAHVVAEAEPSLAMVEDKVLAARLREVSAAPLRIVGVELELPEHAPVGLDEAGPDDVALVCFTSGTTGVPKGAVLRHRNLRAGAESVGVAWRWETGDRLVHALPLYHAHGLCVGVYGTLSAGASAVLLPAFDAARVVEAAREHRASLFFGVPTMYHRLVRSGLAEGLAGLRLCVSGSAPLASELQAEASRAIGSAVLERYGMTETLMIASNPYEGERRAGTVGFPLPGVEVRIGAEDEILVRGPNVFEGYLGPTAGDAFVPAGDGGRRWFRTGDLGADDDGYLVVKGRLKDLVISGGHNVSPVEVEEVLAAHPRVAEVAVGGTPSDEWGEVVTAWVVPDGAAPTLDELAEFAATFLAAYKVPRKLHVVGELPRNALGKVVRSRLAG